MLFLPLYDDTPKTAEPIVTYGLIGACAAVFLWQQSLAPRAEEAASLAYGMIPAVLFGEAQLPQALQRVPAWATPVTCMFLHGGWLHLLGNMLYLWLFGRGVEMAMGGARYLIGYLVCGVLAALTQAFTDPEATVPMIGASGAIAGVLGGYLLLYPRANVVVFVWIFIFVRLIPVPAVILLGLWFLGQLMSALSSAAGEPGVAFWAHIGGFLAGLALTPLLRRPGVHLLQGRRSQMFVPRRGPWG